MEMQQQQPSRSSFPNGNKKAEEEDDRKVKE